MKMLRGYLLMASMVMLGACGTEEHQDIKQWMEDSSRDLRGRIPPLPELKPFPIVSYDAAGFLDPFSNGRLDPEKKDTGGDKPDFDRPKEQLEGFPLESLSFIGIVSKGHGKQRHALIQVDGVVHQVGKGNYLGQNFGRIVSVSDSEISLVETVQDPSGQTSDWVVRPMTLQLQEGKQGKEGNK